MLACSAELSMMFKMFSVLRLLTLPTRLLKIPELKPNTLTQTNLLE
jgi:hypothetical protein